MLQRLASLLAVLLVSASAASLAAPQRSIAEELALLPSAARAEVISSLSEEEQRLLLTWEVWARPDQLAPRWDWRTWLVMAGRGFGKTRTGAEQVNAWAQAGTDPFLLIVGPTHQDVRDTMVLGESGILACAPDDFRPDYNEGKGWLTWPNGVRAHCRSAEKPDRFRGPQYGKAWADELAAWKYPQETWDQIQFGLRKGRPQIAVTTTPRPIALIRALMADPTTAITRGSSYDNRSNLAAEWFAQIVKKYEGTRLGRQELHAEVLDDNPNALWKRAQIDKLRVRLAPALRVVAIGVDPAVTAKPTSDETGIVAAGVGMCHCKGTPELHGFVLDDASGIYKPHEWSAKVKALHKERKANHVVAEINKGGDLVESNIKTADPLIRVVTVRATRGKDTRAEPISGLYEQGKVHHVGSLPKLEDQLVEWNPGDSDSPDRLDALVWVLSDLMLGPATPTFAGVPRTPMPAPRM